MSEILIKNKLHKSILKWYYHEAYHSKRKREEHKKLGKDFNDKNNHWKEKARLSPNGSEKFIWDHMLKKILSDMW